MATIGAYEAKTKFSELLERAEKGERITITRHGKPVAELAPAKVRDVERAREAAKKIRALRKEIGHVDVTWEQIKRWQNEGRK